MKTLISLVLFVLFVATGCSQSKKQWSDFVKSEADTTTITFQFTSVTDSIDFMYWMSTALLHDPISARFKIITDTSFQVQFPLYTLNTIGIEAQGVRHFLMIQPGEKEEFSFDAKRKIWIATGASQMMNTFYLDEAKQLQNPFIEQFNTFAKGELSISEHTQKQRDILTKRIEYLEKYDRDLPIWFREYQHEDLNQWGLYFIGGFPSKFQKQLLPQEGATFNSTVAKEFPSPTGMGLLSDQAKLSIIFHANLQLDRCTPLCFNGSENSIRGVEYLEFLVKNYPRKEAEFLITKELGSSIDYRDQTLVDSMFKLAEQTFPEGKLIALAKAKWERKQATDLLEIGANMPAFYLENESGDIIESPSFLGKPILLDFWSVGCKPCIAAFPKLEEMKNQLGDQLQIVHINLDKEENWRNFLQTNTLPSINLHAQGNWSSKLMKDYKFYAFPNYCLIDKEGKIVLNKAPHPGSKELEKLLAKLTQPQN